MSNKTKKGASGATATVHYKVVDKDGNTVRTGKSTTKINLKKHEE